MKLALQPFSVVGSHKELLLDYTIQHLCGQRSEHDILFHISVSGLHIMILKSKNNVQLEIRRVAPFKHDGFSKSPMQNISKQALTSICIYTDAKWCTVRLRFSPFACRAWFLYRLYCGAICHKLLFSTKSLARS